MTTTTSTLCPCQSQKQLADCCGPYLAAEKTAPTAEALMRSRYTAYAQGNIDYVEATLSPTALKEFDRKSATEWSNKAVWKGLEIHTVEQGQPGDKEGVVDFTAHYEMEGKDIPHRERSLFKFADGKWAFVDVVGKGGKPAVREAVPGRNEPCSCGSGKKYKKCCAG
jgi:SEC-C motif domain protein